MSRVWPTENLNPNGDASRSESAEFHLHLTCTLICHSETQKVNPQYLLGILTTTLFGVHVVTD